MRVDAVSTTGEAIERLSDGEYPIVISLDIYVDERTGLDVAVTRRQTQRPQLLGDFDDRTRNH